MKSQKNVFITIAIAAFTSLVTSFLFPLLEVTSRTQEPQGRGRACLYDHVMSSGTLRVGYTVYPPGVIKGADGKPRGIAVDVLNEVASRLNLKIEWTEEVGWATQIEGLESGRYDIVGTAVWPNPKRARLTTLSKSLFYSPLYFYARSDDTRFAEGFNLATLDDPS